MNLWWAVIYAKLCSLGPIYLAPVGFGVFTNETRLLIEHFVALVICDE